MEDKKVYSGRKSARGSYSAYKRPSIRNRRPPNPVSLEQPDPEFVSSSAKKLKLSENAYDIEVDPTTGYCILAFISVFTAIADSVVCKICKSNVKFTQSSQRGLGFKIVVTCDNCCTKTIPSCPYIGHAYEINRRIIFAMRLLRVGLHGITKFCAFMDLPRPIFHSFYDTLLVTIHKASEAVCKISMKNAANEEKTECSRMKTEGLAVSGDGSWRKRGFSSLFGIVSLIGWATGKVVDVSVKSKYCKSCESWETKKETAEYKEWAETHADVCQNNHEGSSGKMECDAVVEMFQRSEELHGVKYSNYIGDGDSKTFKHILDAEPYQDLKVSKKECIDHVQKRMGTRLRKLKQNTKGLGGKGKLTAKLIDELSIFYGLAIRRNHDSIEKMKTEIWATLYHKISTNQNPQHDRCPPGEASWCSWQKAKAAGTLSEHVHKTPLPQMVFDAVQPIYEDLSRDDLLTRCLGGFTQNSNESFNSVIWAMAPKSTSSGKRVLDLATNLAVCIFNDGLTSVMKIMEVLGIRIGPKCHDFCTAANEKRIQMAERQLTPAAKLARTSLKEAKKIAEEEDANLEGQFYGAGIAD